MDHGLEEVARMKTVTAVFKDGAFEKGEFDQLQKEIIQRLRQELPGVIIRVDRSFESWDPVITRMSGYWEEDSDPILNKAHPIIMAIWKAGEWRNSFKPVALPAVVGGLDISPEGEAETSSPTTTIDKMLLGSLGIVP